MQGFDPALISREYLVEVGFKPYVEQLFGDAEFSWDEVKGPVSHNNDLFKRKRVSRALSYQIYYTVMGQDTIYPQGVYSQVHRGRQIIKKLGL